MTDIRAWLEDLGLSRYFDVFEAEEISLAHVSELTDLDLKDLGLPMGPRKTVLKAARHIVAEDSATSNDLATNETQSIDSGMHRPGVERRQLTVMFCDLVGSTALSERQDPEDLRELMAAYRKAVENLVTRFEGHVAQYLGDGVMAYFGWPRAHEDDAERAVRAAIGIVTATKSVPAPSPLQVRIGIATGTVVVGEGGDEDSQANKLAVGETPNLAARLQGLAGADQIVIGPSTHRLVGGAFNYVDLGDQSLKGVLEPVHAWRVAGEGAAGGRFEARSLGGLTPLVGRDEELGLLMRRWRQACDGEGQVALISGEPGIGKSRLIRALRDNVGHEAHTRLRYQCSPYHANSAFYPVIEQLTRAAGFEREDSPDAKLDKLENLLLQSTAEMARVVPLLATLLSIDASRYPPLDLSPQRLKDEIISALSDQVHSLSADRPVLMLLEDLHWCDPSTLEAFGAIIERLQHQRVFLVVTLRPEVDPPWSGFAHVAGFSLNRLSRGQGVDLVSGITGGKPLPDEVLDQIVAKTDGVPLFVEELTKTVLEAGFLSDTGGAYALDGPLPPLAIPTTLKDSLMARLDRLSAVKEVAQTGACIGREFTYPLLAAVSPLDSDHLDDALRQLIDSELIFSRGTPPDAIYTFKHALVQEVAYESLLNSRRQQIHQRVATVIDNQFHDLAASDASSLAHHYTQAGLVEESLPYWLAAGRQARDRMAYHEAAAHLSKGLQLIASLPEGEGRDENELKFLLALGPVQTSILGMASAELENTYARAEFLCQRVGSEEQKTNSLYGLTVVRVQIGRSAESLEIAERLLTRAIHSNDQTNLLRSYAINAWGKMYLGQFESSLEAATKALEYYDPKKHRDLVFETGWGSGMQAHIVKAYSAWYLGYPEQGLDAAKQAVAIAEQAAHPQDLILALWSCGADLHKICDLAEASLSFAERVRELAVRSGNQHAAATATFLAGWAKSRLGELETGIEEMNDGLTALRATGTLALTGRYAADLGETYGIAGKPETGLQVIAKSQASYPVVHSDIPRIQGDLSRQVGDDTAAEKYYREAIAIACREATKSFELRGATPLARLMRDQCRIEEADRLLRPVYDWFTEGFDTTDLTAAKTLLDELG